MASKFHITGLRKYLLLARGLRAPGFFRLPAAFILGMMSRMRGEKLTLHGGKIFVNTFHAPFPSRSYDRSIEGFLALSRGAMRPLSAYLSVTDRCPFSCRYCSNGRGPRAKDPSARVVKGLIADLQNLGLVCVGFTGGEPLLRKDLESLIAAVDDRSYTLLFTSGRGLDAARAASLKAAGLTMIAVSLDSHIAAEHDAARGRAGAFDDAAAAIRHSAEAGIYVAVSAVFTRDMLYSEKKYEFLRYAGSLGVQEVRMLEPSPAGRYLGEREGLFGPPERKAMLEFQRGINRDGNLPKIMSLVEVASDGRYGCVAGRLHLYVSAAGDVFPCDFTPLSFGNAWREPVMEIYRRMGRCLDGPNCGCLNTLLHEEIADAARRGYPLRDMKVIGNILAPVAGMAVPALFRKLHRGGYAR